MILSQSFSNTSPDLGVPVSGAAGVAYNFAHPSKQDLVNLKVGMDAALALWQAADDGSLWSKLNCHPMYGCIFATQALVDVLAALGRKDAKVRLLGFEFVRHSDVEPRGLAIGAKVAPELAGQMNAHAVVTLGEVLIDPSHAQVKRKWNEQPYFASFSMETPFPAKLFCDGTLVHGVACASWGLPTSLMPCEYEALYYELPWEVRKRTKGWKNAPDLCPSRRQGVVARALDILSARTI